MPPTLYRNVLSTAQHKMSATIDQIRQSVPHAGEIGDLVERYFRNQLLEVLPEKVGVSNGFVVDSQGSVSRQMDIILYDRLSTPRIFASNGSQLFPVESTYACGEIKTDMDSTKLVDCFEKCLSYKRLVRAAYYPQPRKFIQKSYNLFGREFDHWQSIFFCIAANSVSSNSLMATSIEIVRERSLQVHERIDTLVALDATDNRNMLLNGMLESDGGEPLDESVNFLPYPGSSICTYRANEPWSLFVLLLLNYMVQVPTEPINMTLYSGNDPF